MSYEVTTADCSSLAELKTSNSGCRAVFLFLFFSWARLRLCNILNVDVRENKISDDGVIIRGHSLSEAEAMKRRFYTSAAHSSGHPLVIILFVLSSCVQWPLTYHSRSILFASLLRNE